MNVESGTQNASGGGTAPGQPRAAAAGAPVGGIASGVTPQGGAVATFSIPVFSGFLPHLQNMVSIT